MHAAVLPCRALGGRPEKPGRTRLRSLPDSGCFTEECAGLNQLTIEPCAFAGRQGEGEIIVVSAGVWTGQRATGAEARDGELECSLEIFQRRLGIWQRMIGVFPARIEERRLDRDVIAQKRLHGEGVEAALQFAPAGKNATGDVPRHGTGLVIDDPGDIAVGR